MTGLTHQTNELRMTKLGDFVSLKNSSHLPYLLGNLSLLPFENLSAEPKSAWEHGSGAAISETGDRSRVPGPPSFRNDEDKNKKITAGGETVRYAVERREGSKVTLRRTSELVSAATEGKAPKFTLKFDGKVEFDADRGVTTSSESKGKLTLQGDNVTIDVPLVVKLRLLTDEERLKLEKDKQELFAKAKQQQEDAAAKLKQPLTDEDRTEIIKQLKGTNVHFIGQTLQMLAKREPAPEDKAIALAIKPHLESNFPVIRGWAEGTWKTWSKLDDKSASKSDKSDKDKPKAATTPANPNRPARPARPGSATK
jgi:nitrogen fixation protein FixH